MEPSKEEITNWLKGLQKNICQQIEKEDGKGAFQFDEWEHHAGGGGISGVINNGAVIEKGGVNFSGVAGEAPPTLLQTLEVKQQSKTPLTFYATGVSIVLHPSNPMVPIIHMNVRYFELSNGVYWFGGGIDLTPHIIDKEQAQYFHEQLKSACDPFDTSYYDRFKKWADEYFYIPHRKETRGIGGIFFDRLNDNENKSKRELFEFLQAVGNTFAPTYVHLMSINKSKPYDEAHKNWQYLRRGRYAEFNLAWDRGTKFGLQTSGRTESILMSMPPQANWVYNYQPKEGSFEADTLALLKKDIDWLNSTNG